ncbi:hypothetical protein [Campylobacter sp. 2018MI13]|uniref:hypothetical protein n=1 Tax=Campylobacter sp. 2018MI13 TaxID=2836737 RepID=UPI001BD9EE64|nr:hypothetical protein [Campylobacter sp. 2018MI13]MBT0882612.1 hypothetical protein [Campylobacter sp. 2018MI13]
MFKKTLKVLSLIAILGLSANANDLLADISKGAISDNSLGVKVLNTEEMNKVHGGYVFRYVGTAINNSFMLQTIFKVEYDYNEKMLEAISGYNTDFSSGSSPTIFQKNAYSDSLKGVLPNEVVGIAFTQTKTPQLFGRAYSYSLNARAVDFTTGKARGIINSWVESAVKNLQAKNYIYTETARRHGNFALGF